MDERSKESESCNFSFVFRNKQTKHQKNLFCFPTWIWRTNATVLLCTSNGGSANPWAMLAHGICSGYEDAEKWSNKKIVQKQLLGFGMPISKPWPSCQCSIDCLNMPVRMLIEIGSSGGRNKTKVTNKRIAVHDQLLDQFICTLFIIRWKHRFVLFLF